MTITEAKEAVGMTSGDLWKWLLGGLLGVLMFGLSMLAADNRSRLEHIDRQIDTQRGANGDSSLRIRALEANYSDILRRLDRIDNKLDNALGER